MKPASASPLAIAVIPCSRTPKQMLRPEKSVGVTFGEPAMFVRLLATRSALPPTRLGTRAAAFCITTFPCTRVAAAVVGADGMFVDAGGQKLSVELRTTNRVGVQLSGQSTIAEASVQPVPWVCRLSMRGL